MVRINAKVEGAAELKRKLNAVNARSGGRVQSRSLLESGNDIQRAAQNKFLRGPGPRRLERRSGRTIRGIVVDRAGLSRGFIDVGSIAELWWLENYERGLGARGKRPFMRPSLKVVQPTIPKIFERHWKREIDRA